jgi:hypothetical protein
MSVDIKVAADDKLQLVQTYFNDNSPSSDFFNITELPDTLSGGKNAFLIAGSDKLFPQSEVKVQVRDAAGNVCYVEYADGNPEYYEGISKVVAVYVYPNQTSFGPATITVLGQAIDVPDEWQFRFNVKWQKTININPSLPNTTRVRFYKRPKVDIVETLEPIYRIESGSKVASSVTASFANIKISQLETFAGDVKRVKVFRTSEGDISDFDLIQDILIESKELLTTFDITSSVKGNAGIFTNETLKLWNTGSLTASLTNDRLNNGLRLKGRGIFKYNSPLSFVTKSTYEFNLDAFYSSSTNSNLGVYISGSNNGIQLIGTLEGIIPVKNLEDSYFTFDVDKNEPTASLYLSQSQNEWHVANVSLKLSEDSAFSPNQINFISTMPTVIGNERYNFKFEFYDVNNNYVPVSVTQSALFTGGNNNIGGTLILISGSVSSSNAALLEVSRSVSGTISFTSQSVSSSLSNVSSSISGTISNVSSSVSASKAAAISSSFGNIQTLANGNFSGSFISDTTIFAPVIGGNNGYISDLFKVGTAPSIYLDARQNPRKIFIGGVNDIGSYNSGSTSVYMDSSGKFSLKDKLLWDGDNLTINGTINVLGGTAATDANALSYAARAALSASISASAAQTNAISSASGSAYTMATTSANTAFTNAIITSSLDATAKANTALNNAITTASLDATAKSNAAFTSSASLVKLLADGGYSGSFIGSTTIYAPVIGGEFGYFSKQFRVGDAGIVLDGENKRIYIGGGTYGNSNTGFYVDNSGNFSLGNKLSWNNNALIVNGNVTATTLTATTTGSIGGWTIDGTNGLQKVSGAYTLKLASNAQAITITQQSTIDSIDRVKIDASTSLPGIVLANTGSLYWSNAGETLGSIVSNGTGANPIGTTGYVTPDGSPSHPAYSGVYGIIGLVYGEEEIFVEAENFPSITGTITGGAGLDIGSYIYGKWQCNIRVRRFPTSTDAVNQTNVDTTYGVAGVNEQILAFKELQIYAQQSQFNIDNTQVYGCTIPVTGGGGITTEGPARWYRVEIIQSWELDLYKEGDRGIISVRAQRPASNINVKFGRVNGGYSVFSPGGLQVYQGVRNYLNASIPQGTTGDASNFFIVKGKSQIIGSLNVSSGFSAAFKNFKIQHPLNENKWLYHTSTEAPRADLIYRGTLQLQSGMGSASIDLASNMTIGTFDVLTKNPQVFLQNNESFDRIKGYVQSGSVYVLSENQNSTASIDWTVIAERQDTELLNTQLYDRNGNYKTENYKGEYLELTREERLLNYSGSI